VKARPTIFLSGVSNEFGTFRDAVENEVQTKGCFPLNQPSFGPDYQTVEEMLTRKLTDSDAVIHLVGFRFGAEPNLRPPGIPRRSYTQMEFDIARKVEKPVFIFISNDASVRQPPQPGEQPEDDEAVRLQLAHRDAVTKTNYLYYFFKDQVTLCKLVAEIPPVAAADFHADISRIIKYAPPQLIGRENETKLLDDAWLKVRRAESPRPHVLTFVALGGEGKTSLVAKWVADLAHQDWPGCDAVFAWSFYSQGTREQAAASSDSFLKEALTVFGDPALAGSAQGAFDKGRRLAQLVGERRTLLILDGLEPLQYAPTSPTPGELKDQGLAALLKGLAATNNGLCVVTTRYSVPDLRAYWQTTAPETKLTRLSKEAGVVLLKSLGVKGTPKEFETLVEDVQGHALTLNLLGGFLKRAFKGDIRQRDRVKFEKADAKVQGGRAFRTMAVYEQWLLSGGDEGRREVAVLRLMGLFDRPADADCLKALRSVSIPDLTEPIVGLDDDDWEFSLTGLEEAKLLTVNRNTAGTLLSLDAHPLLREYFVWRLRTQHLEAWRAAHRRLYEHLCATTPDKPQPKLEDLQPLYQAVAHGCQAGMQQEALKVYHDRILRGKEHYTWHKLGAYGAELGAQACFFEPPWSRVSPTLTEPVQVWLLHEAGYTLSALGRMTEALEPMRAGLPIELKREDWKNAVMRASNLSELELTLGEVAGAVGDAEQSVTYADAAGYADWQNFIRTRTTYADALHQTGRRPEAEARFREAEALQAKSQSDYPLLYSLWGFRYCDLLLAAPERAAWQCTLGSAGFQPASSGILPETPQWTVTRKASSCHEGATSSAAQAARRSRQDARAPWIHSCRAVSQRAARTLDWSSNHFGNASLLDIALDHLTLGRAALYEAILKGSSLDPCHASLQHAVDGLRRAGDVTRLPRGLLTRAWLRSLIGACTGPESAQSDLDEAWEIAERGPMPLFLADIHLHRARLFGSLRSEASHEKYPWESPAADLAAARRLIAKHGYLRRKEELEDAEAALNVP
jgi:tetratricopeptide (TPR) repeat protein